MIPLENTRRVNNNFEHDVNVRDKWFSNGMIPFESRCLMSIRFNMRTNSLTGSF